MIYEVEGDILLTRASVIVQTVAIQDPMTRGLARKLRDRFPVMLEKFRQWCEETDAEPGQIWSWGEPGKKTIVNLITHEADDDPTRSRRPDKIALNHCLKALNSLYVEKRFQALAMPMIGAGEYGHEWTDVRDMMQAQLRDILAPIYVYTKELEGQIAHEPSPSLFLNAFILPLDETCGFKSA